MNAGLTPLTPLTPSAAGELRLVQYWDEGWRAARLVTADDKWATLIHLGQRIRVPVADVREVAA